MLHEGLVCVCATAALEELVYSPAEVRHISDKVFREMIHGDFLVSVKHLCVCALLLLDEFGF